MYFFRLPYIIYREYLNYGYLTDNRFFGYDTASKSCVKIGDRILSKTGSIFYSKLLDRPQSLLEIAKSLVPLFSEVSINELVHDAEDFFSDLSKDGFVGCTSNVENVSIANTFSYSDFSSRELPIDDSEINTLSEANCFWCEDNRLLRIHIDISGLCNEHCVHCYIPESYRYLTMSKELFLDIIKQCKECNVLNITISGGEPMLNSNLAFFIKICREENFSVNLLSNLTLMTDELVNEFKQTPLLSVQTSLYSLEEVVHDSITKVSGSCSRTKRAIEILHNNNIPLQINCPIMKQNKDSYMSLLDWARLHNIEASSDFMLMGCFDGSGKNLNCRLEMPDVETILREDARNIKSRKLLRSRFYLKDTNKESHICPVCVNSLCVSHIGDVYPCEGWQSYIFGNVKETTIAKLWKESDDIQKLRNLTYEDFPKCNSCEDKDYCSICLIRNVNESPIGSYMDVNPYFCEITRIKKCLSS